MFRLLRKGKSRWKVGGGRRGGRRWVGVERLERREVLATFLVVNTNDIGVGSLRDAILQANATAGPIQLLLRFRRWG